MRKLIGFAMTMTGVAAMAWLAWGMYSIATWPGGQIGLSPNLVDWLPAIFATAWTASGFVLLFTGNRKGA